MTESIEGAPTGESNPAPPPKKGRGGRRPGAGRKKRPPDPEAAFDIARHIDPQVPPPEWTAELVDRFLRAYYAGRCSLKKACQATGVPYRAALAHRDASADFADRLEWAERVYRDDVRSKFQKRVMTDPHRPANIIFDLKSRDPGYAPVSAAPQVKVAIAITDSAFKGPQVIDAQVMPALPAGDASG